MENNNSIRHQLQKKEVWITIFICLLGLILFIHAFTILRYPAPSVDEAWLESRAWGFIKTGHTFGILDSGVLEKYDHYWIVNQYLITFLHSLVLRIFPKPSLLPLRIFSLGIGICLLLANYFIAYSLKFGRVGAIFSSILLALSLAFFHSAHQVRYDILATTLAYSSLAILLMDGKGKFLRGLLAGLLSGLAVETHLNSVIFIPAIGVSVLIISGWRFWRNNVFWGYLGGCLIGLFLFLSLHVFPNPESYFTINSLLFSHTQRPPILSGSPTVMALHLVETVSLLFMAAGPMLLLAPRALSILMARHNQEDFLLICLNVIILGSAWAVFPTKPVHYAIYITPIFLLLITSYLIQDFKRPWNGKVWNYISRAFILSFMCIAIGITLMTTIPDSFLTYKQDQKQINDAVLPDDVIMGPQNYWFGLTDHTYRSWELLFLYPRFHPGSTLDDAMNYFQPDILIIDASLQPIISDDIDPSSFWYYYHISKKELMAYLDHHAKLVIDRKGDNVSLLKVYRITP